MHAHYGYMDSQSEVFCTHHNLQRCSVGKGLGGLNVTTTVADIDQSAAGCDAAVCMVDFGPQAAGMSRKVAAISGRGRQQSETGREPQASVVAHWRSLRC